MVSRPIAVTKRLSRRPRYLASEGAFTNGVHRQQAQQRGDNRRAHGLNQVEDIGVGIRHHPCRAHDEHHAQGIELAAGDPGFIPFIAKAQDQTVQPFERAEIVAENDLKMATVAMIDAPYSSRVAKVDLVPDIEAKWFAR